LTCTVYMCRFVFVFFWSEKCARDSSLLYLLLALGTVWLGTFLYKFKQTPYLTSAKRELLTDYALPVSVIIMSIIGSLFFREIIREFDSFFFIWTRKQIESIFIFIVPSFTVNYGQLFSMVRFQSVNLKQIIGTGILGFSLSLLMFLVCWQTKIFSFISIKNSWFFFSRIKTSQVQLLIHLQINSKKAKLFMSIYSLLLYSMVYCLYLVWHGCMAHFHYHLFMSKH